MAITDLTGTTWVFNGTFPHHFPEKGEYYTEGDVRGLTPTSDYGYFIDFIWKDESGEYNCNYIYNYNYDAGTTIGVATYPNGTEHYFGGTMTITGGTDATNADLITWLQANATLQTPTTPSKSIDLTTLSGWSSLSTGSHNITIVAKADGYKDSKPSAAVSVTKAPQEYTDCITFTGETSDFTLKASYKEWNGTVEYSTDHQTWKVWNGGEITSVSGKLYLRGSGNTTFWTSNGAQFALSAKAGCSGNLNTLLEYSNPPTTLSEYRCYSKMFYGCTNLTTAPALPATTLENYCYNSMFKGCTNLTTAPALPATTLASGCYNSMFEGCTNLTTAPALPATTLADNCYQYMFYGCTNLTTAPALPATTLENYCYDSMFLGCTSLTTAPALPATTLAEGCYQYMFYRCTSLTTAPALPATTLADGYCYSEMFYDCTAFKVSSTQTGSYQYAWRIPTIGTISYAPSDWNYNMLTNTGGTFTSDPSINTTYYVENEPV